jgi:hypothetical protein
MTRATGYTDWLRKQGVTQVRRGMDCSGSRARTPTDRRTGCGGLPPDSEEVSCVSAHPFQLQLLCR